MKSCSLMAIKYQFLYAESIGLIFLFRLPLLLKIIFSFIIHYSTSESWMSKYEKKEMINDIKVTRKWFNYEITKLFPLGNYSSFSIALRKFYKFWFT